MGAPFAASRSLLEGKKAPSQRLTLVLSHASHSPRFSTGSLAKFTAMRHASSRYLRYSGAAGAHKRAPVKSNLPHGAL